MAIFSPAVEDYLKAIYELQEASDDQRVSTTQLAERLDVSGASVTGMLKKLSGMDPSLADYKRYYGVTLTDAGEKIALEIIRHHRLIEAYLIEALGYTWDEVHSEADQLEHVISEALEQRIAAYLGHPSVDPHGDPIPDQDGNIERGAEARLTDLSPGDRGYISRVSDDPELLRYLDELDLGLHAHIEVTELGPFEGPVHVRLVKGEQVHALSRKVTDQIFISSRKTQKRRSDKHVEHD